MRGGQLTRAGGAPASVVERHPVVAVAGLVLGALLAACGGDGDGDGSGYGPGERSDFVEACAAGAGSDEDACECFYDRLVDEVPHDRFVEIDEQIRDDPTAVPDDIADMAVACSAPLPDGDGDGDGDG